MSAGTQQQRSLAKASVHLFAFTEHCITVRLSFIPQAETYEWARLCALLFRFYLTHVYVYVRENRLCQSLEFQQYGAVAIVDAAQSCARE